MFVIISSVLTFFCYWRNWHSRMQHLQGSFQPLEIRISSFNSLWKKRRMNVVANVWLLKNPSLFFLKFVNMDINILSINQRTWTSFLTLNCVVKHITSCILIGHCHFFVFWFCRCLLILKVIIELVLFSLELGTFFLLALLALSFILAISLLELSDYLLELFVSPVVKVIATGFRLEDVLLELLWVIVFLDNLVVKELLLVFLGILHQYIKIQILSLTHCNEQLVINLVTAECALLLLSGASPAHLLAAASCNNQMLFFVTFVALWLQGVHHVL